MDTASRHLLLELYGCEPERLDDVEAVRGALAAAARAAGVRVVAEAFHQFTPQGVTAVLLVEESHLAIHTWPEAGYVAADCFTCGSGFPEAARDVLIRGFSPRSTEAAIVHRGLGPDRAMTLQKLDPGSA